MRSAILCLLLVCCGLTACFGGKQPHMKAPGEKPENQSKSELYVDPELPSCEKLKASPQNVWRGKSKHPMVLHLLRERDETRAEEFMERVKQQRILCENLP